MSKSFSNPYKESGVDIAEGYKSTELIKKYQEKTIGFGKQDALGNINENIGPLDTLGGFGGLFGLDISQTPNPVLVSGTDGVGTKLKLAFLMNKHDTVGIDCVAMCVNDIICTGAKPLYFLDYIACGKNYPEKIALIVKGITEGCIQSETALIGGETAEMPGFYKEDEYDLAGFSVGVVDKEKILDKNKVKEGDVIIGLPSSGVHSNGFSLIRKIFDIENADLYAPMATLNGKSLGETLLTPTRIYVKPILNLIEKIQVKSISHITGGGFYENIPRSLPTGYGAVIPKSNVRILPIFNLIAYTGDISDRDMFNTFNMGVGMTVIVSPNDADDTLEILKNSGEDAYILGHVVSDSDGVNLI